MVRHIVLLHFAEDVADDAKADIYRRLHDLRHVVPGFVRIVHGPNVSPEGLARGFDDGFVIDFTDAAARDAYLDHPEHRVVGAALVAMLDGGLDGLLVVDIDDEDRP